MERLSLTALGGLPTGVEQPALVGDDLKPGIVHLGLGAFHRAHQAVYTQEAMRVSGGDWGIIGVSMRSDQVAQQLRPQDQLYSVWSRGLTEDRLQIVGVHTQVLVASKDREALDAALADPCIRVVTLTITEKGYCLADDGRLDIAGAAISTDLADPQHAQSAIGVLARGLARRYEQGGAPATVISCDNLSENGAVLRSALHQYIEKAFPHMLVWFDDKVRFPCSMVDRIVPAMNETGLREQAARLYCEDKSAIATEPFSQWIIERNFATEVPDWTSVGVQFVDDIRPYEAIKLRVLNAAHSVIACCGLLAGRETVADVMTDPILRPFIERLMTDELGPALDVPLGFDLDAYREQLLLRFANPHLHHRCAQIATDSSEKIPQRWLATLRALPEDSLMLRALAAWCYLVLVTEIALDDPRETALLTLRQSSDPLGYRIGGLLGCLGLTVTEEPLFDVWVNQIKILFTRLEDGIESALMSD